MKTGQADLPLHGGKAPAWLFNRMIRLAKPISEAIILEYGQDEFLRRISDPMFFQSFGCVLGFDWHSSGVTTTVGGALKMALDGSEGVVVAGGKGKYSRDSQKEIEEKASEFGLSSKKIEKLLYSDRISAKVDSALVQDSYELYHHNFFFSEKGRWAVVQQGMNENTGYARRYHWLSDEIRSYVEEPHSAIAAERTEERVLNLSGKESSEARKTSLDLVKEGPSHLKKFLSLGKGQATLSSFSELKMPKRHNVVASIDVRNFKALERAYEASPENYEELLMTKGVGGKTVRALALISNLIYGSKISWEDPAKFSYAHGGKDGFPYPVDRETYDRDIEILNQAVRDARIGKKEKFLALKRIGGLIR